MSEAACAVCGKVVATPDQYDHLQANHLGPHYFWMGERKFRTMKPSMNVAELRKFTETPVLEFMYREQDGGDVPLLDGETVSLVGEPHFYTVPPATMFG